VKQHKLGTTITRVGKRVVQEGGDFGTRQRGRKAVKAGKILRQAAKKGVIISDEVAEAAAKPLHPGGFKVLTNVKLKAAGKAVSKAIPRGISKLIGVAPSTAYSMGTRLQGKMKRAQKKKTYEMTTGKKMKEL
jgi:hypothetical protein